MRAQMAKGMGQNAAARSLGITEKGGSNIMNFHTLQGDRKVGLRTLNRLHELVERSRQRQAS
ncbi:MAG TPA: hypothetical protein VF678_13115, partial [bacterium]